MKYFTTLLLLVCFQMAAFSSAILEGHVSDATTLEPLIGANVMLYEADKVAIGAVTDEKGYFKIEIPEGTFKVEVSFNNYRMHTMEALKLSEDVTETINVFLDSGAIEVEEEVSESYSSNKSMSPASRKKRSMPTGISMGSKAKKSRKVERSSVSSPAATRMESPPPPMAAPVSADGVAMTYDKVASSRISPKKESIDPRVSKPYTGGNKRPSAGQLTAGEWNDLDNWNFWAKSLREDSYARIRDVWKMYPTTRYSVFVQNDAGFPMPNAEVLLSKSGKTVWATKTDNKGVAELWANMFEKNGSMDGLKITVNYDGQSLSERRIHSYGNGINTFTVQAPCKSPMNVDVMFAVDATGSMGDEINYLKSELKDVMARIKKDNDKLNIRLGSVFYRDKTDDYVTRAHPFSSSLDRIVGFFNEQEARGGGDFPEAVEDAMDKAINGQKWSPDAIARILFLVLDAPPHSDNQTIENLHKLIKEAARQGIKIVPITASGINRSTEYLMKMMTLSTNGTYTFLTDHSGIGGKHLDPVADSYNVETLNDLMVRVVLENIEYQNCSEDQSVVGNPNVDPADLDPLKSDATLMQNVHFFPNPAVSYIHVSLQDGVDQVTIHDATGKQLIQRTNLQAGETKIELKGLTGGQYYIRFVKDGKVVTNKLVVVQV